MLYWHSFEEPDDLGHVDARTSPRPRDPLRVWELLLHLERLPLRKHHAWPASLWFYTQHILHLAILLPPIC